MIKSFIAAETVPAYRFVKFTTEGISPASSSSDEIVGISEANEREVDETIDVYLPGGYADVTAGAAFEAGAFLTADEEGRAIEGSSSDNIGAMALQDAEEEGDIVQVVVMLQRNAETTEDATEE